MPEFDTYKSNLTVRDWHRIPYWAITQFNHESYTVRVGVTSSTPKEKWLYEDDHISLYQYLIDAKKVLGYVVTTKKSFLANQTNWYLGLANPTISKHSKTSCIFKDLNLHLHSLSEDSSNSYLLALRAKKPREIK